MLPRLSQRTYDLMRRAIDAVDRDTADLITTPTGADRLGRADADGRIVDALTIVVDALTIVRPETLVRWLSLP